MKCSDLFVCLACLGCREYYEAPDLKITALNAMLLMEGAIVLRTHRTGYGPLYAAGSKK